MHDSMPSSVWQYNVRHVAGQRAALDSLCYKGLSSVLDSAIALHTARPACFHLVCSCPLAILTSKSCCVTLKSKLPINLDMHISTRTGVARFIHAHSQKRSGQSGHTHVQCR